MDTDASIKPESSKFHQKRQLIIAAATDLMNEHGVKGMTLTKVAQAIDLNTTSVTYYFKRKELLAEAILASALDRYISVAERAAAEPTPARRLERLVWDTLHLFAEIRAGEAPPIANLSHIQVLQEPIRTHLTRRYLGLFRLVRGFLGADDADKTLQTARTHVLLEDLFWTQAWLRRYSLGDYERLAHRLTEVLSVGVGLPDARWQPKPLILDRPQALEGKGEMNEAFLRSATTIMNERGYRGASVERIAADLSVTKGSFYHHLDSKDDLILACFDLSYAQVSLAQRAAQRAGGSYYEQICSTMAALIDIQLFGDAPLLRTTALSALPQPLRDGVIERSNRMARRFAGMLIDGISEGSIRPIDPLIAAQTIMAALNTAYEMRQWAKPQQREDAIALYASIAVRGMLD